MKPYLETVRISRDADTKEEFEARTMLPWADVRRLEEGTGDHFRNSAPKCIIFTYNGTSFWVLESIEKLSKQYRTFLDHYLIHSPLRN